MQLETKCNNVKHGQIRNVYEACYTRLQDRAYFRRGRGFVLSTVYGTMSGLNSWKLQKLAFRTTEAENILVFSTLIVNQFIVTAIFENFLVHPCPQSKQDFVHESIRCTRLRQDNC